MVDISVTGLGTLSNKIASASSPNPVVAQAAAMSHVARFNASKSVQETSGLTSINSKMLSYTHLGKASGPNIVFVHGLGGTSDFFTPLVSSLGLAESHSLHFFDLEGHGLSPTLATSSLSVRSFAKDVHGVFEHARIASGATLVAHSLGCLVAIDFVLAHPGLVRKLVLLGPPPTPLPEAGSKGALDRATLARTKGMSAIVDAVVTGGTSQKSKSHNPLGIAATRISLLGQDPEGYAKACAALAGATTKLSTEQIEAETFILTGSEDKVSPPSLCERYGQSMKHCTVKVLEDVGHWHIFEDPSGVAGAVKATLLS